MNTVFAEKLGAAIDEVMAAEKGLACALRQLRICGASREDDNQRSTSEGVHAAQVGAP